MKGRRRVHVRYQRYSLGAVHVSVLIIAQHERGSAIILRRIVLLLPLRSAASFAGIADMPARRSSRLRNEAPRFAPPIQLATKRPRASAAKPPAKKRGAATSAGEAPLAHASRAREEAAWAAGVPLVLGCDEAGRGPLAGPVVAAACALPASAAPIPGVGDSKTITDESVREELYEKIISTPGVMWSARVISAARIDEINILMASLEAMRLSLVDVMEASKPKKALALIDGPFSPWKEGEKYVDFQQPQPPASVALDVEPIKGGDGKVYCIAAASIIAKVTRDRLMHAYDKEWPAYGLAGHKGYPTAQHVSAIAKHGAVAIHRRTFAPLKTRTDLKPPTTAELAKVEAIARTAGVSSGGQAQGATPSGKGKGKAQK